MRKPVTTIEGLDKKFDQKFDKFGQILENIQGSIEVLVKKVAENTQSIAKNTLAIDDNTSSIQHLIGNALMRDELQPILDHVITQSESRMISHMEGFIRRHITVEEEVLIHGHKIGVIERVLGLPNAM